MKQPGFNGKYPRVFFHGSEAARRSTFCAGEDGETARPLLRLSLEAKFDVHESFGRSFRAT